MRLHEIQHEYTESTLSSTAPTLISPLAMLAMQNTVLQCPQHFQQVNLLLPHSETDARGVIEETTGLTGKGKPGKSLPAQANR